MSELLVLVLVLILSMDMYDELSEITAGGIVCVAQTNKLLSWVFSKCAKVIKRP